MQDLSQLVTVFTRTEQNIRYFMDLVSPIIANAQDEHQRMYFHHIFEEEEQHLERLNVFIPKLSTNRNVDKTSFNLIGVMQDINLEKFGQHNFLEHLELALFHFNNGTENERLRSMIEQTKNDYLIVKDILFHLNEQFLPSANQSKASDHHSVQSAAHDGHHEHDSHFIPVISANTKKGLSVGSLK